MRKLASSDWGTVAEIVTALTVVVSLVFVGYEIRKNTQVARSATMLAMADQDLAYFSARIDSRILAGAEAKYRSGEELSEVERLQIFQHQQMNFRIFENAYYQYRRELLEPGVWERYRSIIRLHLEEDPIAAEMWEQLKHTFTREFQEEVTHLASDVVAPR